MAKKISSVASEIYDILEPLEPDDRKRVVHAALTLLGDPAPASSVGSLAATQLGTTETSKFGDLSAKAKLWIKQYALSSEQIEQVFHFGSDSAEIIASIVPGTTNNEKCRNAYLLVGTAQLLTTGEPNFSDEAARAQCTKAGAYDSTNHGKFLQKMGNEFAGTKSKGWTLTGPGLKAAATLVKEIASPAS